MVHTSHLITQFNFNLQQILNITAAQDAAVFGMPEPSVQELVTACVVRKKDAEVEKAS